MNKNPIKQKDLKFGVPNVFNKIFDDLQKQINDGTLSKKAAL